ncbi:MAG: hypothetical protein H0W99_13760 [Acidobacteria bacterium]|nr:hypothetical protein [Acidobacteriota bacterium]
MKKSIALLWLLVFSMPLSSQTAPPATQLSEMKRLDYMVGQWKGTGWIEQAGRREAFAGTETIQSKLNGLALLVEGKFKAKVAGKDEEVVIHETLAVLSFDEKAKMHRFRTYLVNGITGDHEVRLIEGGWQWGFQFPAGAIRYVVKVDKDQWFETGEISQDGKTWRKFFEMTLNRVK